MTVYIARRLLGAIPLLIVTSFIVFAFLHIAPGSPETILLGGRNVDVQTLEAIREQYHLNDGFLVQYWEWLKGLVTGDLGQSIEFRNDVSSIVWPRVLPTVELALYALLLIIFFGLPLGVISGVKRNTRTDSVISSVILVGSSISTYVSGILLIAGFSVALGWFPVFGLGDGVADRLYHLTLPAIALAIALMALLARTTRAALGRTLTQEFVDTARSRGFTETRVVARHALRNALVPVVTITGLVFGYLISGAVLVEYTFGLSGLGSLLVQSVQTKDYAVVQAVTIVFTAAFIIINLCVDLVYAAVDPRVRLHKTTA